jgi:hypothetical protein
MKKMILAVVVGYGVQLIGLFLIHSVLLRQDYVDTAALWRPREAQVMRVWAMLLAVLIYVVGAVLVYLRGVKRKPWMGQGIRFGILLAMVAVVYGALSGWVILPIPHMLAVKWIVSESLLSVVFGLAVAGICKPSAA